MAIKITSILFLSCLLAFVCATTYVTNPTRT